MLQRDGRARMLKAKRNVETGSVFSDHDEVNPGGNISELISEEKVDL